MVQSEVINDDKTLRAKFQELLLMITQIETGLDGIPDEEIPSMSACFQVLNDAEKHLNRESWLFVLYTLNKAIVELCNKGRARHDLSQRMRRIQVFNEIKSILDA